MKDLFNIIVNREILEKLMHHLSDIDEVSLGVNKRGEVTFEIPPKSKLDIYTINPLDLVNDEINILYKKINKLSEKSAIRAELEMRMTNYIDLVEILEEKMKCI